MEKNKPYRIEFELPGLPKTINVMGQKSYWVRKAEKDKWLRMVWMATAGRRPASPLTKARVSYARYSSCEPDWDGLVSGFKYIQDSLKACGLIADDKMSVIGQPQYAWFQAPAKQGKIRVIVEEILSMEVGREGIHEARELSAEGSTQANGAGLSSAPGRSVDS
jgi:hypothetical protein